MVVFYNPSFPQLGAEVALASGLLLPELFQLEFGAREVALEAPEIFLAAPEMVPTMELAGDSVRELEKALEFEPVMKLVKALEIAPVTVLGDCSVKSMSSELSTLGFFCTGLPLDLVRYRLAGGFGGAGFTGGGFGLDGEGSGAEPGLGSFRRLFLRFEGDEDLAPRVRAISGHRTLAGVANLRG